MLRAILPQQGDTYRRQPSAHSMHSWKLRVKRIALSLGVLARAPEFMGHFCRPHRLRRHWLCKLNFPLKPRDHLYPTSGCRVQLVCLATGFWLIANPRPRPVHYGETASPVCIICVLRLKLDIGRVRGRYVCKIWPVRSWPLRVDRKVHGGGITVGTYLKSMYTSKGKREEGVWPDVFI